MEQKTVLQKCEAENCTYMFKRWGGKKYCFEHADLARRERISKWIAENYQHETA